MVKGGLFCRIRKNQMFLFGSPDLDVEDKTKIFMYVQQHIK